MPSKSSSPNKDSTLFLETSAVLNYIKVYILKKLSPTRANLIKDFIIACSEKQLSLHSSSRVYEQAKYYRSLIRQELLNRGFKLYYIERMLQASERKVKRFMAKLIIHKNLSNEKFSNVESFFRKYQKDFRCIKVWATKSRRNGIKLSSPMPEKSDLEIFAQALTLADLYFITTDDHFGALCDEIEDEFNIVVITHNNVYKRMREWGW